MENLIIDKITTLFDDFRKKIDRIRSILHKCREIQRSSKYEEKYWMANSIMIKMMSPYDNTICINIVIECNFNLFRNYATITIVDILNHSELTMNEFEEKVNEYLKENIVGINNEHN